MPPVNCYQAYSLPVHFLPEEAAVPLVYAVWARATLLSVATWALGGGEASWSQGALGSNSYHLVELKSLKSTHGS